MTITSDQIEDVIRKGSKLQRIGMLALLRDEKRETEQQAGAKPKRFFAVITIKESGAGLAFGTLGAPAGVEAGRYALVEEDLIEVVPDPQFPWYSTAILRAEAADVTAAPKGES
jgi:hypothetical protein